MNFVAAVCPQCGGNLQLDPEKESGFCMHCGTKIDVKMAIKAVQINNSHMVDTWMELGDSAAESNNNKEAYEYYTKVVETQPNNWSALFKRGKSAGWQSTLTNIRLVETAIGFAKAIELAPWENDEKESLIRDSVSELSSMSNAIMRLRAERFEKWPDDEEANGFFEDISIIDKATAVLAEKAGVEISGYSKTFGRQIESAVNLAFKRKISPEYHGDDHHPGQSRFHQYIKRIDRCVNLLEKTIAMCEGDNTGNIRRYKQIVSLEKAAIESCSWDYEIQSWGKEWRKDLQLSNDAKLFRQGSISFAKEKIADLTEQNRQKEIAEKRRKEEEYWATHPEEKILHDKQQREREKLEREAKEKARLESERQKKIEAVALEQKRLNREKLKRKVLIFAGTIVAILAALLIISRIVIPQKMLKQAKENVEHNQLAEALKIVNNLITRQPNHKSAIIAKVGIAQKYIDQNSFEESFNIVNDIMETKPTDDAILDLVYGIGLRNYELGQYSYAKSVFSKIPNYKDSIQQVNNCDYEIAQDLAENNEFNKAITVLNNMELTPEARSLLNEVKYRYGKQLCDENNRTSGLYMLYQVRSYKDSEEVIIKCNMPTLRSAEKNQIVYFGETSNGDPMAWKVLDKQGNRILLFATRSVTEMSHAPVGSPKVTWSGSQIRKYLNNEFYRSSFTNAEAKLILTTDVSTNVYEDTQDKVFLLSSSEVLKYIPNEKDRAFSVGFWLRDKGGDMELFLAVWKKGVWGQGTINSPGVFSTIKNGIMPAMWISLDNN